MSIRKCRASRSSWETSVSFTVDREWLMIGRKQKASTAIATMISRRVNPFLTGRNALCIALPFRPDTNSGQFVDDRAWEKDSLEDYFSATGRGRVQNQGFGDRFRSSR